MDNKTQLGLNELLKWSITNATQNEDPTGPSPADLAKLDPKWIDVMLGKPDAVRMRDAMAVIADRDREVADRLVAFDELELLVEHIDNAIDLRACGLWRPLLDQLADPTPEIRAFAAWVTATALQNNPKAIADFDAVGGIDVLVERVAAETDAGATTKLVAVVSALVNQSPAYTALLHEAGTLQALAQVLHQRPHHAAAKRVFHMLANLVESVPSLAALFSAAGWLAKVVDIHVRCTNEGPDYLEKCLVFVAAVSRHLPAPRPLAKATYQELADVVRETLAEDPDVLDAALAAEFDAFAAAA
ncbi:hsp70 nucleotide exchange factor fes1 [Blastocladiella emersonii ATCC 22665]|nr:hsp70 nucleotide exchange factor fes1 [Blastocladiella emersonii ATCC 22665]